jgi:predicted metal-binding protein
MYLDGTTLRSHSALSTTSASILPLTLGLCHHCFGHLSVSQVKHLSTSNVVNGITVNSNALPDPVCEPCIAGKQHRIINKSAIHAKVPLEIVHCDLHGPMPVASVQGHKYFIVFVDDATRLWCLYFLRSKSDAAQTFLAFRAEMEKQTGHVVKCLHDDKEGV